MQSINNSDFNMIPNTSLNPNLFKINENLAYNQFNNNNNIYNYLLGNFPFMNYPNISFYNSNSLLKSLNFNQNNFNNIKGDIDPNYKISSITIEINNKNNGKNEIKKYIINNNKENEEKEDNNNNNNNINISNAKPENIINISLILSGKEKRTFLRLHPIPKRFSVYDMVKIIDKYLKTKRGKRIYNAVYLPLTKKIGKNIGYFFINMVSPKYVILFYNIFNGFYFRFKNFNKSCSVLFADNQEINISSDEPTRRPIIFTDVINE